jgi:hypothetical protein
LFTSKVLERYHTGIANKRKGEFVKIYIILDGSENIIRGVFHSKKLAEQVREAFSFLGCRIEEFDLIGIGAE